jgi:hypothetical protein
VPQKISLTATIISQKHWTNGSGRMGIEGIYCCTAHLGLASQIRKAPRDAPIGLWSSLAVPNARQHRPGAQNVRLADPAQLQSLAYVCE